MEQNSYYAIQFGLIYISFQSNRVCTRTIRVTLLGPDNLTLRKVNTKGIGMESNFSNIVHFFVGDHSIRVNYFFSLKKTEEKITQLNKFWQVINYPQILITFNLKREKSNAFFQHSIYIHANIQYSNQGLIPCQIIKTNRKVKVFPNIKMERISC